MHRGEPAKRMRSSAASNAATGSGDGWSQRWRRECRRHRRLRACRPMSTGRDERDKHPGHGHHGCRCREAVACGLAAITLLRRHGRCRGGVRSGRRHHRAMAVRRIVRDLRVRLRDLHVARIGHQGSTGRQRRPRQQRQGKRQAKNRSVRARQAKHVGSIDAANSPLNPGAGFMRLAAGAYTAAMPGIDP